MIFHSYVSLPEGTMVCHTLLWHLDRCFPAIFGSTAPRFRGVALARGHESTQTSGPLRSEGGGWKYKVVPPSYVSGF